MKNAWIRSLAALLILVGLSPGLARGEAAGDPTDPDFNFGPLAEASSDEELASVAVDEGTVPEPSSVIVWGMLGAMGLGVAARRKKKNVV